LLQIMLTKVLFLARLHLLKLLGLVLLTSVQLPSAWAQAGGPLFCDAQFYQIRVGTGGTRLLRYPDLTSTPVNVFTGNNQTTTVPNLGGINMNGLGFNHRDNYLYTIALESATGNLPMYRLGTTGGELVGQIAGVSNPFTSTAGVFDKQGRYYFAGQATIGGTPANIISPSIIYRVDNVPSSGTGALTIARSYNINVTPLLNFGDFAFSDMSDGINGVLYGTTNQGLGTQHVRIVLNDAAGTANTTVVNATGANTGGTGSAFYDQPTDRFFMFSNVNNAFYQIQNFATGTPNSVSQTAVFNAPLTDNTGTSDGTACIFAGQQQADIGVTKTASPNTPRQVGETVSFTITAFNVSGSSPARNVIIDEQLPPGLTFVSAAVTTGTYFAGTSNWVIPSLPAGTTQTLTLIASVNSVGTTTASYVNVATTAGASQVGTTTVIVLTDPVPSNNTATATVTTARGANLSISKTNNVNTPATLTAGQTTSYTITVSLGTGTTATDIANAVLIDPAATGLRCVIGTPACTTSGTAGSICPALGAGAGQLSIANLQGAGVLIPLLKPGSQMAFKVDCGVTASGL
jgi:uncharacterized repeat protein (TIGR01451 family)